LIYDVELTGPDAEVVFESTVQLEPGTTATGVIRSALLFVAKGSAKVWSVSDEPANVKTGEYLVWASDTTQVKGPFEAGKPSSQTVAYFNKIPIYNDDKGAQAMLKVLDSFAEGFTDNATLAAKVAELRQPPTAPVTAEYLAGARYSVLCSAALQQLPDLADSLNDATRADLNTTAIFALRHLLATDPSKQSEFLKLATSKLRLNDTEAKDLLQLLHGTNAADRTNAQTLTTVVNQLNGREVAQRSVALYVLLTEVDPTALTNPRLIFTMEATAQERLPKIAAWKKRIEDLLAKQP
jgi:hypothetical protein